ncbi:retinol dehydrogenase 7-like, partial [Ahaetulla prasina]|uniref:retinol dehydrogenase 7-like n=1 Tax=Ahaetulla prasina TaxID=499056 RepID=UPI00264952D5
SVQKQTDFIRTVQTKGLWGLVNNTSICYLVGPNEWLRKEDFAKVLEVNLLGPIDVTLQMLPLVRRASGRVVNLSSVLGRLAIPGGGYCLSKFAVEAFSDTLRRELFLFGIRTSIIELGGFATDLINNSKQHLQSVSSRIPPHIKESYGQQYLDNFLNILKKINLMKTNNMELYLVTNCIEHALTSHYPRTRYLAGWDAKLLYLPASYLPSAITDYFVGICVSKPAQAM